MGCRHYLVTTEQERHLFTEMLNNVRTPLGSAKLDLAPILYQNRVKLAECSAIVNRIDPHPWRLNTSSVSVLPTYMDPCIQVCQIGLSCVYYDS